MSDAFRELLKKVGSGPHTSRDLTRWEASEATRMMLTQEATPAQIGAFMISHRIKRPTGEELAGILDAYDQFGPKLQPIASAHPVTVLGIPYDGRSRTAPLSPITALLLATANCPVIMHGGDRMPTKHGIPLIEVWRGLGVNWALPPDQIQTVLEQTGLGFVYLPYHFPLAQGLVPYRDQIGKRPPLATVELIWSPYAGDAQVIAGFVHPPTETMFTETFALRGVSQFATIKGLEGSCDLPRDRTAIIGIGQPDGQTPLERLLLSCRDYDLAGKDVPLTTPTQLIEDIQSVLQGQPSEMMQSAIWNGGFYLWRCGASPDLQSGLAQAEMLLTSGQAQAKLQQLKASVNAFVAVPS
jgi:anthranilate phosphoribosyltransferase